MTRNSRIGSTKYAFHAPNAEAISGATNTEMVAAMRRERGIRGEPPPCAQPLSIAALQDPDHKERHDQQLE